MHRRVSAVVLFTAIALAACSTDVVVSPLKAPVGPKLAVAANASGNYLVMLKGNGIPKDFVQSVAALGGKVTYAHGGAGIAAVSGLTDAAAATLASNNSVADLQEDFEVSLDSPTAPVADQLSVGEPAVSSVANPAAAAIFARQWNMKQIHADSAWAHGKTGSNTITVAILDTGLDYDNADLNGQVDLSRSTSFVPGDDAITTAFFPGRNNISDYNGHGTNVASQVSSAATFFAGVTSRTRLIGIKVLGWNGSGSSSGVLAGILYAADHGANVANMSLGGSFNKSGNGRFLALTNRVLNYAKQKGMLVVVAAGNALPPAFIPVDLQHNGNQYNTYCDAPHVICVAAVGPTSYDATKTPAFNGDVPAWYSYYGKQAITVAAPGGNNGIPPVLSVWPWGADNTSWVWSLCSKTLISGFTTPAPGVPIKPCSVGLFALRATGTSQASPHVAGLAALLMAEPGAGGAVTIKHIIEQSAVPLDAKYGGAYGSRIDVKNALGL